MVDQLRGIIYTVRLLALASALVTQWRSCQ